MYDERIILKRNLNSLMGCGVDLSCLGYDQISGSFEHRKEYFDRINLGVIDKINNNQLLHNKFKSFRNLQLKSVGRKQATQRSSLHVHSAKKMKKELN
jgi:hypothetical protein